MMQWHKTAFMYSNKVHSNVPNISGYLKQKLESIYHKLLLKLVNNLVHKF